MIVKFDENQIDWLADLLADAANEEIMPRFRQLGQGDIRQKTSPADLVRTLHSPLIRLTAPSTSHQAFRCLV